jgi:hypothetical protein
VSTTLNEMVREQILAEMVREQILAEMPQLGDSWISGRAITCELNSMTPEQLLERISDAMEQLTRELPTRLGI